MSNLHSLHGKNFEPSPQVCNLLNMTEKGFLFLICLVLAIVCFVTLALLPEYRDFSTPNKGKEEKEKATSRRNIASDIDGPLVRSVVVQGRLDNPRINEEFDSLDSNRDEGIEDWEDSHHGAMGDANYRGDRSRGNTEENRDKVELKVHANK